MKAIMKTMPVMLALAVLIGCTISQSRNAFNTLASVQAVTTGAYNSYLDLVLQNKLPTNSVPAISRDYNLFQLTWSAAVAVAQWNTNAIASDQVVQSATKVLTDINKAKE